MYIESIFCEIIFKIFNIMYDQAHHEILKALVSLAHVIFYRTHDLFQNVENLLPNIGRIG